MTDTPVNLVEGGNHILELAGNELSSLGLKPIYTKWRSEHYMLKAMSEYLI